jgi:hypothetical protein
VRIELAQDRVQWRALVLAVLNLRVLLPGSKLISEMDLKETGCEAGRWIELAQDHVQWRALVLSVLQLEVLIPESYLLGYWRSSLTVQSITYWLTLSYTFLSPLPTITPPPQVAGRSVKLSGSDESAATILPSVRS